MICCINIYLYYNYSMETGKPRPHIIQPGSQAAENLRRGIYPLGSYTHKPDGTPVPEEEWYQDTRPEAVQQIERWAHWVMTDLCQKRP